MCGYGISAIGTGLCYPFLTIYLHQFRGLPARATALLLLVLAGAAVPMSVYGGSLADRHSPRLLAIGALLVQAAGWLVLATGRGYGAELLAMLLVGVGTGLFLPAVIPVIARLSRTDAARTRTMSMRYLLLNVGLGLGAGIGGTVLGSATEGVYRWLFAADGASCALYAVLITALVPLPRGGTRPAEASRPQPARFRPGLSYLLLLAAELLLVTFGLAQAESGIPLAVRTQLGGSTTMIGVLYAIATLVVVAGQLPVSRLVEQVPKTRALICMALVWTGAWLVGYAATAFSGETRVSLLVVMMVMFALGECAYSPAFYTLVEELAPAGTLGRSSGAAWATFQLGNTLGPPIAVYIISSNVPFWPVLAVAAAASSGLVLVIDRRTRLAGAIARLPSGLSVQTIPPPHSAGRARPVLSAVSGAAVSCWHAWRMSRSHRGAGESGARACGPAAAYGGLSASCSRTLNRLSVLYVTMILMIMRIRQNAVAGQLWRSAIITAPAARMRIALPLSASIHLFFRRMRLGSLVVSARGGSPGLALSLSVMRATLPPWLLVYAVECNAVVRSQAARAMARACLGISPGRMSGAGGIGQVRPASSPASSRRQPETTWR